MKKLILALLILAGTVHAQSLIVISGSKTVAVAGFSDTFPGTGALSASWTTPGTWTGGQLAAATKSSGAICTTNYGDLCLAYATGYTAPNNQIATIAVTTAPTIYEGFGVLVRANGAGNGYWMHGNGNTPIELDICTSGSCAAAAYSFCGGLIAAGSTYSLGVHGNVLTCYVNAVAAGTPYTDASNTYTSGYVGFGMSVYTGGGKIGSFTAAAN